MSPITIPILPSADFDVTAAFYAPFGFTESGRWPGDYLILRHEAHGIELHFWLNATVGRWDNDVACYVRFETPSEARSCHAGWAHIEVPEPAEMSTPQEDEDGSVEFHIIDLHGNLVRLGGFAPRELG